MELDWKKVRSYHVTSERCETDLGHASTILKLSSVYTHCVPGTVSGGWKNLSVKIKSQN